MCRNVNTVFERIKYLGLNKVDTTVSNKWQKHIVVTRLNQFWSSQILVRKDYCSVKLRFFNDNTGSSCFVKHFIATYFEQRIQIRKPFAKSNRKCEITTNPTCMEQIILSNAGWRKGKFKCLSICSRHNNVGITFNWKHVSLALWRGNCRKSKDMFKVSLLNLLLSKVFYMPCN